MVNKFVVSRAVVFCEVISQISFSWGPVDLELVLDGAVVKPVEAHVNGFGSVLLGFVVKGTICSAVVGLNRGRGLFVSQFNEGDLVRDCSTGIEIACTGFRFSSGGSKCKTHF